MALPYLLIGLVFGVVAYREAAKHVTTFGAEPFGIRPMLWLGMGLVSLVLAAVLLHFAKRQAVQAQQPEVLEPPRFVV
jgi:hypothetical protein